MLICVDAHLQGGRGAITLCLHDDLNGDGVRARASRDKGRCICREGILEGIFLESKEVRQALGLLRAEDQVQGTIGGAVQVIWRLNLHNDPCALTTSLRSIRHDLRQLTSASNHHGRLCIFV